MPPCEKVVFDHIKDHQTAKALTARYELQVPRIIGIDTMNEVHHKFYVGLKFVPKERW